MENKSTNVVKSAIFLLSILLLGAKCATNSKAVVSEAQEITAQENIEEIIPELKEYSKDIDITKYDNLIKLVTYEELTFQKALRILKTKTDMNIPVLIIMRTDSDLFTGRGELKSECSTDWVVWYTDKTLQPYTGIIFINGGFWTAIELDAYKLFDKDSGNNDKVSATEYCYANETVYITNEFSSFKGLLSRFDKGEKEGEIQGDGSLDEEIITEFDK